MKLIGIKRLIILAALLGINVLIAALYFLWVDPMLADANTKLASTNGEISSLHSKISSVQHDLDEFKKNLPKYEALKASGFMDGQDRFQASRELDALRLKAGLAGFSFNINDVGTVKNSEAEAAKMQVISSRIDITKVSFLLDNNFYAFLDLMSRDFPQQLRVTNFELVRKAPLDQAALSMIGAGRNPDVLTATASMEWVTIIPLTPDTKTNAGGR